MKIVVCPHCHAEHPGSRMICSQCGEGLLGVERTERQVPSSTNSQLSHKLFPTAATHAAVQDHAFPKKPVSRLQLAFSLGLFFLIILAASLIFQEIQPVSKVVFMLGILIGFFGMYVKNHYVRSTSSEGGGYFTESPLPDWLIGSVAILVGIIVLIFMFGWDFMLEWLFSTNPGERFLALVLGSVFGIIIELSLSYILRTVTHMRSR